MKEQKGKFTGENEAVKFDIRYREFLGELKSMPRKTKEEKENRVLWFKNHESHDDFILDALKMCKPRELEKLRKMMSGDAYATSAIDPGFGMATFKEEKNDWKFFDWAVLMENLNSAVEDYTGENQKGESYLFLQSLGKKYNQLAEKEAGKNDAGLLPSDVSPQKRYLIFKLSKKIKDTWEHTDRKKTLEEIAKDIAPQIPGTTKKILEEALRMVYDLDIVKSLDQPIGQEDGDAELGDRISNPRNDIEEWEEKDEQRLFWKKFSANFLNKWKEVEAATKLKSREALKYFLSKDILMLLKLKPIPVENQKQYEDYLEPKCGQWCHRKRCTLKGSSSNKGCYVRYGYFPGDDENETGDEEIYDCLKKCKGSLYDAIFNNEYTQSAYSGGVQNLDDMYEKPLKDYKAKKENDRFEFTDVFIEKATGIAKASLSRYRRNYENNARKQLRYLIRNDD